MDKMGLLLSQMGIIIENSKEKKVALKKNLVV